MEKEKQVELIEKYLGYTEIRKELSRRIDEFEELLDKSSFKTKLRILRILEPLSEMSSEIFHKSLLRSMDRELKAAPDSEPIAPGWFFEILEGRLDIPHKLKEKFNLHALRIYRDLLEQPEKDED